MRTNKLPPEDEPPAPTDTDARRPGIHRSCPPGVADRYTHLELADKEVVIHDRENTRAWIQSSHSITLPS